MKTTIDFYQFREAFRTMDRMENFSREGQEALFDWCEQYEEETGQEMELDVVALCCDFYEMEWRDIASNYRIELDPEDDDDAQKEAVLEYLNDNTMVVADLGDSVLFQCF